MCKDKVHQPEFGRKVRRYRQGRGLSQSALGRAAGVPQWTVSRIEKGHTSSGAAINKLNDEIGLSRDEGLTTSKICQRIADSDELKALVRRVLAEIGA